MHKLSTRECVALMTFSICKVPVEDGKDIVPLSKHEEHARPKAYC